MSPRLPIDRPRGRSAARFLALILLALASAACPATTPTEPPANDAPGGGTQDPPGGDPDPQPSCQPQDVPWLVQGNFWRVAWSWIEIDVGWTESYGDYDLDSYTMKLGAPVQVDDKTMYELQVSGVAGEYGPRWRYVGADGCGNVYGQTSAGQQPVLVYAQGSSEWSGEGFWADFTGFSPVTVTHGAAMAPSQYTRQQPHFDPPLTAVGYSESSSSWDPGGCEYFPGYGTICTEGDAGPTSGTVFYEYWDDEAGPVGMHFSDDYEDCLGFACNERHHEVRIEVWFFGEVGEEPIVYEDEPDTYADPTPFPVSEELLTMFGAIGSYDTPSGYLPGYSATVGMDLAAEVHDWFAFEITPELAALTVEFYLAWNDPVELGFYLFTDPDHPIGFTYLAESFDHPNFVEFEHTRVFSGTYQPGKYLLGVRRETPSDIETGYGIFSIAGDPEEGGGAGVIVNQLARRPPITIR